MTNALILSDITTIICDLLIEKFNISYKKALDVIYSSKLYGKLTQDKLKLWYYSGHQLCDMLLLEKKDLKIEKNRKITSYERDSKDFIISIIEFYKLKYGMTSKEVYDLFLKYGILDLLFNSCDYFGYLMEDDIFDEINDLLRKRGYNFNESL